jgi:hypothetical protein
MVWEDLLSDIEAQAAGGERLEVDAAASAIAHAERARTTLMDRWQAACGRRVSLQVQGGHSVAGTVSPSGSDVLLLAGPSTIVRPSCVMAVTGSLTHSPTASAGPMSGDADAADVGGLGLAAILRLWSRHRRIVAVGRTDGSVRRGTVIAVGLDHLDLVMHDSSTPLAEAPAGAELIPFWAVAFVQVAL